MNDRDAAGRFTRGNEHASAGGRARAEKLSPARRREIARAGFAALSVLYFDGSKRAAAAWLFDPLGYNKP